MNANKEVFVTEDFSRGTIKINKTAEDGIVADREFKVNGSDGSSYTKKTNAAGVAEFSGLKVYDVDLARTEILCYPAAKADASYSIPESVNTIGTAAFYGGLHLEEIIIPETVTTIEE